MSAPVRCPATVAVHVQEQRIFCNVTDLDGCGPNIFAARGYGNFILATRLTVDVWLSADGADLLIRQQREQAAAVKRASGRAVAE